MSLSPAPTSRIRHLGLRDTRRLLSVLCVLGLFIAVVSIIYLTTSHAGTSPDYYRKQVSHFIQDRINPKTNKFQPPKNSSLGGLKSLYDAASNRTLGVQSIRFINLPHRYDKFDAAAIQSFVSGIDIETYPAVLKDNIQDTGMPPTENKSRLGPNEKACWRAHANVWQEMIFKNIPALLIMEADAAWDVMLRESMGILNQPFRDLLSEDNNGAVFPEDASDPWLGSSGLWDVITLGHCSHERQAHQAYRVYDDEHAPSSGYKFEGHKLNSKRVVFRASGMACTAGYMVSKRGAAKLLTRSAMDLNEPIDLLMKNMARDNDMILYSVLQQPIAQWVYMPGIGMEERGANSDIAEPGEVLTDNRGSGDSKDAPDGWPAVKKSNSVWKIKPMYASAAFKKMALQAAWGKAMETGKL